MRRRGIRAPNLGGERLTRRLELSRRPRRRQTAAGGPGTLDGAARTQQAMAFGDPGATSAGGGVRRSGCNPAGDGAGRGRRADGAGVRWAGRDSEGDDAGPGRRAAGRGAGRRGQPAAGAAGIGGQSDYGAGRGLQIRAAPNQVAVGAVLRYVRAALGRGVRGRGRDRRGDVAGPSTSRVWSRSSARCGGRWRTMGRCG